MKREHTTQSNSLLDWLKSKNCILYSPLSQNDTTDWISGNAIELYNSNSMVWDSAHDIWKFQKVGGQSGASSYFARWELKEVLQPQSMVFTAICQFYAYYDWQGSGLNCVYDFLPTRQGMSLYGTLNNETESAQIFGIENSKSKQMQYRDGSQVFTYNYTSILQLPQTTHIRIAAPNNGGNFAGNNTGPYGVRNFAFFLKAFTLSEINEYFNLI